MVHELEEEISKRKDDHYSLNEKLDTICKEFDEVNNHVTSCVEESSKDSHLLELLDLPTTTPAEMRMRVMRIVSRLLGNWCDCENEIDKLRRDLQTTEESCKLKMDNLENEKVEESMKVKSTWQAKLTEKQEEMESLQIEIDHLLKERDMVKIEMENVRSFLEKEKNEILSDKENALEQVQKLRSEMSRTENELFIVKEQLEQVQNDAEKLTRKNANLLSSNEELKEAIRIANEKIERKELDIDVLQNERNHLEDSLIEKTTENSEMILKLFNIVKIEDIENTEKMSESLPGLLEDLVRKIDDNSKIVENLKQEKTQVCNQIRLEFETVLSEKEAIFNDVRENLKNTRQQLDDTRQTNTDQLHQIKILEEQVSVLRGELDLSKDNNEVKLKANDDVENTHVIAKELAVSRVVESGLMSSPLLKEASPEDESRFSANYMQENLVDGELESLTKKNDIMKEELQELQNLYNERNNQISSLVSEIEELKCVVERSRLLNEELTEKNDRLQLEISQLGSVVRDETDAKAVNEKTNDLSKRVAELEEELLKISEERTAYEKLRRDFDHIVSGLRGDLERVIIDRNNTLQALDELRSQVHDRDMKVRDEAGGQNDTFKTKNKGSSKDVENELESTKHDLKKVSLINRQLKELGKTLDLELKMARKDKQLSEKKCQDLRDEMEEFVKEKEGIIIESRERMATREKLHENELKKLQTEYEYMLRQQENNERSESKELTLANEKLQMKLNDAYEEINNVNQLEENNIALKQQVDDLMDERDMLLKKVEKTDAASELLKIENGVLLEKVNELKSLVDEADKEIERRDEEILKSYTARDKKESVYINNEIIPTEVDSCLFIEPKDHDTKSVNTFDYRESPGDQFDIFTHKSDVTSESAKLEREYIQTSGDYVNKNEQQLKFLMEDLERKEKETAKMSENLRKSEDDLTFASRELEKVKKTSQKLKTMVKNCRSEIDSLNVVLSQSKEEILVKEQCIAKLRKEMSEVVSERDDLFDKLMSKVKKTENDSEQKLKVLQLEWKEKTMTQNRLLEDLNVDLKNALSRGDELKGQLDVWRCSYTDMNDKANAAESEIITLRQNKETLHNELNMTKDKLQNANNELLSKLTFCDDLSMQLQEEQKRVFDLQKEMSDCLNEKNILITQLQKELEDTNKSFDEMKEKLMAKSNDYQSLLTEKDELERQLEDSQNEIQNTILVNEGILTKKSSNLEEVSSRAENLSSQLKNTSEMLDSEKKRREELDDITCSLREDLDARTEEKRELETIVMALNVDLNKALKDREELRQALRVKQTITQGTENPCFDQFVLDEKINELKIVQNNLRDTEEAFSSARDQVQLLQNQCKLLESKLTTAEINMQERLTHAENEKLHLEEIILSLKSDLQQSSKTKEEAIDVLRKKLEHAVEERGGAVSSLRQEYDGMLKEKDCHIASLQDEIQKVNEEFTNLGYRFELTLQDNVNKGNNIIQLQNQLHQSHDILQRNDVLEQELSTMKEQVNGLELNIHELVQYKSECDSFKIELEASKKKLLDTENRVEMITKEYEVAKSKQKKEFKRLYDGLQFDLKNSRKQNIEKEKRLQCLREELEVIMKEKEALTTKIRSPMKAKHVEKLQKAGDPSAKQRDERKIFLQNFEKDEQEKDQTLLEFHRISEGLRRDLETAINDRDEKTEECLKANIVINQLKRSNDELQEELKQRDSLINSIKSGVPSLNIENSNVVQQLRADNEKLHSSLMHESINAREAMLKMQNTNDELRQSITKAEHDRENMRNYVAAKEIENDDLKRQLENLLGQQQSHKVVKQLTSLQRADVVRDLDEVSVLLFLFVFFCLFELQFQKIRL